MRHAALSEMVKKLPVVPQVLGKDRYRNAAIIVPLLLINDVYHLLFQKRSAGIRQGSEICFPGGMFDEQKDRSLQDTALRETMEELGIGADKIVMQGRLDTLVTSLGVTVDPFLAVLTLKNIDNFAINTDEVEAIFLLPVAYLKTCVAEQYHVRLEVQPAYCDKTGKEVVLLPSRALGLPERYHHPWGGSKSRVLVYKTTGGVIWGVTAEILHEFLRLFPENDS